MVTLDVTPPQQRGCRLFLDSPNLIKPYPVVFETLINSFFLQQTTHVHLATTIAPSNAYPLTENPHVCVRKVLILCPVRCNASVQMMKFTIVEHIYANHVSLIEDFFFIKLPSNKRFQIRITWGFSLII